MQLPKKSWMQILQEAKKQPVETPPEINLRALIEEYIKAQEEHFVLDTEFLTPGRGRGLVSQQRNPVGPRLAPSGVLVQVTQDGWVRFRVGDFNKWLLTTWRPNLINPVREAFESRGLRPKTFQIGAGTDKATKVFGYEVFMASL